MNTTNLTHWNDFKKTLQQHPDLTLQFQYATDLLAEVKAVEFQSISI